jgi:hypothetical protein
VANSDITADSGYHRSKSGSRRYWRFQKAGAFIGSCPSALPPVTQVVLALPAGLMAVAVQLPATVHRLGSLHSPKPLDLDAGLHHLATSSDLSCMARRRR